MTVIGFHASHEQISPSQLLADVQHAAQAGFTAAMCSDHLEPWSVRQGESGFAWAWLGAAMQATDLPFGLVTAPGQRYHPAIVAQAIATLAQMFPQRLWAALGSGENLNEHVTGEPWPDKNTRNDRLAECADIIHRLLRGHTVTHHGLVTVDRAQVYSLPAAPPPLFAAATSPETAKLVASWSEGLITVGIEPSAVADVARTYRESGGAGPVYLQLHLAYARDQATALALAHDQWRTNVFSSPLMWDLDKPEAFDEAASHVRAEDLHEAVRVSVDLDQHAAWITEYADAGFDGIMLHHVGKDQREFIDAFGEHVLPQLAVTQP